MTSTNIEMELGLPYADWITKDDYVTIDQVKIVLSIDWVVIILEVFLLIMCLVNCYRTLIRQGKWNNFLFMSFYVFAFLSCLARLINAFVFLTYGPID